MIRENPVRSRLVRLRTVLPLVVLLATAALGGCYYPGYHDNRGPGYHPDHDSGPVHPYDRRDNY